MCTGTQLPQKPPHTGIALHKEPWHTPAAPHTRVPCAPSHPIPSLRPEAPGMGKSLADVAGISSHAGGHAHHGLPAVPCRERGPRDSDSPKAGLAPYQLQLLQGRMSPEGEWERSPPGTKVLTGLKVLSPIAREGQGCSGSHSNWDTMQGVPTHSYSQLGLANRWLRGSSTQGLSSQPQISTSTSGSHQNPHRNMLSRPAFLLPPLALWPPQTCYSPPPCGTMAAHSALWHPQLWSCTCNNPPRQGYSQGHRLTLCHPFTI